MSYLNKKDIIEIKDNVRLLSIKEIDDVSHYLFDSHIKEYDDFLNIAEKFYDLNISKTFLLIHTKANELLAYMSLSADSIKLKAEEKEIHNIAKVPYAAMPRAFAFDMNEMGIACRFVTVDADIEYDPDTPEFYFKNGFVENLSLRSRNAKHTISMRKDIFVDE